MKLKTFLGMVLCAAALFAFTSCDNGNGDGLVLVGNYDMYMGEITATQGTSVFKDNGIVVELTFNNAAQSVNMVMNQVKFAEAMPVRLDIAIDGLSFTKTDKKVVITGDNIIPTALGGPFEKYIITRFSGTLDAEGNLVFDMLCGGMPVNYIGEVIQLSIE